MNTQEGEGEGGKEVEKEEGRKEGEGNEIKTKSFSDKKIARDILISVMEMLQNYEGKAKKDFSKSERSQLSHQTIAYRLQDLSNDIKDQLIHN